MFTWLKKLFLAEDPQPINIEETADQEQSNECGAQCGCDTSLSDQTTELLADVTVETLEVPVGRYRPWAGDYVTEQPAIDTVESAAAAAEPAVAEKKPRKKASAKTKTAVKKAAKTKKDTAKPVALKKSRIKKS